MTPTERRRDSRPAPGADRRGGDRRSGQAAVLDHRRATDRRLDAAGASFALQRRAFQSRVVAEPRTTVVVDEVVVDLRALEAAPVVDMVRCPLCDVLHDRLWLFAHVARDHASGR